jgi:AGCS family alanine or glycine:cation symporter
MTILKIVDLMRDFLWSGPLIILLIGTGLFLTLRTGFIQFKSLAWLFSKETRTNAKEEGDISPLQALMTGLAGAIGTGTIAGVATAVSLGGFGAIFWMWIVAFFGMATAFFETVLSIIFRQTNNAGEIIGGPMTTLKYGLKSTKLAQIFAIFGLLSALGFAMVQANSVSDALSSVHDASRLYIGILCAWILLGGVKRVANVATALVPLMLLMYLGMSLVILWEHSSQIVPALIMFCRSAFSGQAAVGGFLGAGVAAAMQNGVKYGIFASEAGLGSLAMANAAARTKNPLNQGFYAMFGVFFSMMIICTITGLVLAVTNVLGTVDHNGHLVLGSALALKAFGATHPYFVYLVIACLILFAFTTIFSWAYYGEKCLEFLVNVKYLTIFRVIVALSLIVGATTNLRLIWNFAHLSNGLMMIPNLISLVFLSGYVVKLLRKDQNG